MPKKTPWNQDRSVGPRTALTRKQVIALEDMFIEKQAWHDHALLRVAIDSMLRGGDLLRLKVKNIMVGKHIREYFYYRQEKTKSTVVPVFTVPTQQACLKWIRASNKQKNDYLFTRNNASNGSPVCIDRYRKLIKEWVESIGLDSTDYSTHSFRRTKSIYLYQQGTSIEHISELLGHKDTRCTKKYLGLTIAAAHQEALKHDIFRR